MERSRNGIGRIIGTLSELPRCPRFSGRNKHEIQIAPTPNLIVRWEKYGPVRILRAITPGSFLPGGQLLSKTISAVRDLVVHLISRQNHRNYYATASHSCGEGKCLPQMTTIRRRGWMRIENLLSSGEKSRHSSLVNGVAYLSPIQQSMMATQKNAFSTGSRNTSLEWISHGAPTAPMRVERKI